jgi:ribosomal-protein-alanine N-acetyltransferase
MQQNCSYSTMAERDLEEVISIEKEVFRHPWSMEFFRLIISDSSNCVITLRRDNAVVGYGGYHLLKKEATFLSRGNRNQQLIHLINIAVRPPFQNQGFGTLLLDILLSKAKRSSAEYCYLEVRPSNTRAFHFYQHRGFSVIGVIENYYPIEKENAVVMGMELLGLIQAG